MRTLYFFTIIVVMASVRLRGITASLVPSPKHKFTVLLATPGRPTPTFLHQVQQSDLNPQFIGEDCIFFREPHPSSWLCSHVFLFQGVDIKLDSSCDLRQAMTYTVEADEEFAEDDEFEQEVRGPGYQSYTNKTFGVIDFEEPKDLAAQLRPWLRNRFKRLWVMTFLNFTGADADERYKEHLAEKKSVFGLKVHLFGKVTSICSAERGREPSVDEVERAEGFAMLSFPGEKEYAGFLMSEEHRRLVAEEGKGRVSTEDVGVGRESTILTKELRLPPKDQVIHRYGWQYGNPYEAFGQDFFG